MNKSTLLAVALLGVMIVPFFAHAEEYKITDTPRDNMLVELTQIERDFAFLQVMVHMVQIGAYQNVHVVPIIGQGFSGNAPESLMTEPAPSDSSSAQ